MRFCSKPQSWVMGAIATLLLLPALPSQAATLAGSFSLELEGKLLSGSFAGENQSDDGQFNAWDLSSFNATWGDFSWDLTGLGGFRMYYEPGAETGLIDWIYAQQYQSSSQQVQTLGYVPLQVGVIQFSVTDLSGTKREAYHWRWEDGIRTSTADVPETPQDLDPSTSVPEPGVLLGLGAIAAWTITRRDRRSA